MMRILTALRLWSGLVLFAYVIVHMGNLALGLVSLAEMDRWRLFLLAPWRTLPGEVLLAGAALVHTGLGLQALAARRSLALGRTDLVQLVLGLATPPLLIAHVMALKVGISLDLTPGFVPSYAEIMSLYWSYAPLNAIQQLFVLFAVWVHAAIGIHSWLVLKPIWRRIGGIVVPVLFLLPILALLGFAQGGKEVVARLASDTAFRAFIEGNSAKLLAAADRLYAIQIEVLTVYALFLILALAILAARLLHNRRRTVHVSYDGGYQAEGRLGLSILELSRLGDVPHAHVCSGRGRCGTCRVMVETGAERLSPASERERATLLHYQALPGMRLACQALVHGDIAVTRVMPAYADAESSREERVRAEAA